MRNINSIIKNASQRAISGEDIWEQEVTSYKKFLRINAGNMEAFSSLLSLEQDADAYLTSPVYLAFTGRKGLWIYNESSTYVPLCWHPNVKGQILIFPPRGGRSTRILSNILSEIPLPPSGIRIARVQYNSTHQMQLAEAYRRIHERVVFLKPVEEDALDWRYPVHILSTKKVSELHGHNFMAIRNHVRHTQKYSIRINSLSKEHIPSIERLVQHWASLQAETTCELADLLAPYKELLRLFKSGIFRLKGLAFIAEEKVQAVTMWDISNSEQKTANLYMNLCNTRYRGLSEFAIHATATKLHEDGVPLLNLGGSETEGLDRYKRKFAPIQSIALYSVVPSIMVPSSSVVRIAPTSAVSVA